MNRIHTGQPWFDRLIPEGIPTHTSTLITGPGGSGKPLIGNLITAAWLRQGGSAVFMSLQYPSQEFIAAALKRVAQVDLDDCKERVAFIELDITQEDVALAATNRLKANVVRPEIWDAAISEAYSLVPNEGPGILFFGSALNLLLFSPTYSTGVLERMKNTVQNDKQHTYLFTVSTSAQREQIAELEAVADNCIESRSVKSPFRLFMHVVRMKDSPFISDEVEVPFPSELLVEVKEVADHSRLRVIPSIRKL